MDIKIYSDHELSLLDREQLQELDLICFGKGAIEKAPLYYFAPTFKHILLFDNNKLVSHLRIVLRDAYWQGRKILIGGIGSVATDPDFQGKGYASLLLQEAIKILRSHNVDFGLLQTNISKGGKLYGKIGFIPANVPYEVLDIYDNKRKVEAKDVMIAPVRSPELVSEIMNSNQILFIGKGDW